MSIPKHAGTEVSFPLEILHLDVAGPRIEKPWLQVKLTVSKYAIEVALELPSAIVGTEHLTTAIQKNDEGNRKNIQLSEIHPEKLELQCAKVEYGWIQSTLVL